MSFSRLRVAASLLSLCSVFITGLAQTSEPPGTSLQGLSLPLPVKTGKLGSKAPLALAEITALLQAASVADWKDLEATGTITFPAGDAHTASLTFLDTDYSRLDITMDAGTRSLRVRGPSAVYQTETGMRGVLPPSTSTAGILSLPRVWTQAATGAQISLYDAGPYQVSGKTLHRITIEYPLQAGDPAASVPSVATDLYFDPATHLLLYSVDAVQFSETHNQVLTRVTSYGSYQVMAGILIPTSIQQSLNEQLQWTLQINQLTVNTNPPVSTFSF